MSTTTTTNIVFQQLPWDSSFLGFPVARLDVSIGSAAGLEVALAKAWETDFKLFYIVIDPADSVAAEVAQSAGARLADRKVTFCTSLLPEPITRLGSAITTATEYNPQLESLAWQSGEYSRFRLDPRFATQVFKDLYSQWLHNSLTGEIARRVLVFRDAAGAERGLLTLGEKNNRADIGLLAVDEVLRGQGVAQSLVAAAIEQAREWGYNELQVATQYDNKAACRFYEKCGFRLLQEQHIYHLWQY